MWLDQEFQDHNSVWNHKALKLMPNTSHLPAQGMQPHLPIRMNFDFKCNK